MENSSQTEESEERCVGRERKLSHYIIYYTQFVIILTFGTVSVGLWPYLNKIDPSASKTFLGYLFAVSGLGQTIFSPVIGLYSNKLRSNRALFVATILLNVLSLLMHAFVESFPSHRKYWLLLSRFISGTSAANVTICRSHISSTTYISERRKAVSLLSSTSLIALGLGAGIQLMTVPFGDFGFYVIPGVNLNMYNTVAWILILLEVINLIFFHPKFFKEHPVLVESSRKSGYAIKNFTCLAFVFVTFNFLVVFNGSFERVLGTPLLMDQVAMTRKEAVFIVSILNVIFVAICFIISLLIDSVCKKIGEYKVLMTGLALFVIGRCLFFPVGSEPPELMDINRNVTIGCPESQEWCNRVGRVFLGQIVVGMFLERVAQTVSTILVMVMFSKILGSRQQGAWMGYITASGSLARIIAPIIITSIYAGQGPTVASVSTNLVFTMLAVVMLKITDHCILKEEVQSDEMQTMNETRSNNN